jgi:hypothetical protein
MRDTPQTIDRRVAPAGAGPGTPLGRRARPLARGGKTVGWSPKVAIRMPQPASTVPKKSRRASATLSGASSDA